MSVVQSDLPADAAPAHRLKEYMAMVRELSLARDPHEMIELYRRRARLVVPGDHVMSFSRLGMEAPKMRITRSTRWAEVINPWKQPERLPVIEGGMAWRLMIAGTPIKIDELTIEPGDPVAAHLDGMRSLIAAPVFHEGEPLYMTFLMDSRPARFSLEDLANFLLTTNLIGRATSQLVMADELRRAYAALDREFSAVGSIQRQLLPKSLPEVPGVRIATYYETSTRAGGDHYDVIPLPEEQFGVMIADVSGHGPAAAVVMAQLHAYSKAAVRACPADQPIRPAAVLDRLNGDLLNAVNPSQFVTAFFGVYNSRNRSLWFANAGHNPPRWLRNNDRAVVPLRVEPGMPLAIAEPYEAFEAAIQLAPGDRLLLYTDGITEGFNDAGEMFGESGVDAALSCCSRTPQGLIDSITRAFDAHTGGRPAADDRTLVALAFD